MSNEAKCPFTHTAGAGPSNRDWWPNQLNLKILHQNSSLSDPMGKDFNYAKEFKSLDLGRDDAPRRRRLPAGRAPDHAAHDRVPELRM
jgi:catalase (peroxidase I)